MTDVLEIARDRRAELNSELARINEFIRMADSLLQRSRPRLEAVGDGPAEGAEEAPDAESSPRVEDADEPSERDGQDSDTPRDGAPVVNRLNLLRRSPTMVGS